MEKIMEKNVHKKFDEKQNALRLYIINKIIDEKSFNIEKNRSDAMRDLGMSMEEYDRTVEVLRFQDGMVTDEEGNINFIYPVSALPTNHHVKTADGREFCAMCAIDSMGAAFTLHTDTVIDSVCAVCGEPVHVEIKNGRVASYYPEDLHALTFPLGEISNWSGSC